MTCANTKDQARRRSAAARKVRDVKVTQDDCAQRREKTDTCHDCHRYLPLVSSAAARMTCWLAHHMAAKSSFLHLLFPIFCTHCWWARTSSGQCLIANLTIVSTTSGALSDAHLRNMSFSFLQAPPAEESLEPILWVNE